MTWKVVSLGVVALLALVADVRAANWTVIPEESKVEFTGVQMGVPTRGEFTSLTSAIEFDRDDLAASSVRVVIDLNSVSTSYALVAKTLGQEPWFNIAQFPQATFEASEYRPLDDVRFEAHGTLTLRGVSRPISFTFEFKEYGPNPDKAGWVKAVMDGETTVQRTAFGVGQGEWGATNVVADDVVIKVHLSAERESAP